MCCPLKSQGHTPFLRSFQDFHSRIKVQIGFQLAVSGQSSEDFGGLPHCLLHRHAFSRPVFFLPAPVCLGHSQIVFLHIGMKMTSGSYTTPKAEVLKTFKWAHETKN